MFRSIRLFEYVRACRDATTGRIGPVSGLLRDRAPQRRILGRLCNASRRSLRRAGLGGTRTATNSLCHRDYCPSQPSGDFRQAIIGTVPGASYPAYATLLGRGPEQWIGHGELGTTIDNPAEPGGPSGATRRVILIRHQWRTNALSRVWGIVPARGMSSSNAQQVQI